MAELGPHEAFEQALDNRGSELWGDALLAIELICIGRSGIGGLWLKARAGGVRDLFLEKLQQRLGNAHSWTRLPPGTSIANLIGGVDLAATAKIGHLVRQPGLLARAEGGVLVIPMAERLDPAIAALVTGGMDEPKTSGHLVVALDESLDDEAPLSGLIGDRLALRVDLDGIGWHHVESHQPEGTVPTEPGSAWRNVTINDRLLKALAALSLSTGHRSPRILGHLVRTARLLACRDDRAAVVEADVLTALRLCLGIRLSPVSEEPPEEADTSPPEQRDQAPAEPAPPADPMEPQPEADTTTPSRLDALTEMLAAVQAGTLSADPWLSICLRPTRSSGLAGKSGGVRKNARRGRPFGIGLAPPHAEARPDIIATLRAAAPFQKIRAAQRRALSPTGTIPSVQTTTPRAFVTRDDFRYVRLRHAAPSTAIFVVDASGSTALERLGETKGAIEQLLARCYVRRDEVALIAFRGTCADLLLPPTRSLTAAKRKLAGLPGGGPTPLAAGLKAGLELALSVERRGSSPVLVLLTDGSGNIALDGTANRTLAAEELTRLAATCKSRQTRTICIDIARRPRESVTNLARMLGADLHVLRKADAGHVSHLVDLSMKEGRT
jgi:magnesium chelatase subunit D